MSTMTRINLRDSSPGAYASMVRLSEQVDTFGVEPALIELVKVRASQLNGCAFCLDMHTKDARAAGEEEIRLHVLAAWREAPFYTARERAALALAEAVTQLSTHGVDDAVYAEAAALFSEQELAGVLWAIVAINAWNRIAVATQLEPGHYQPGDR